MWQDRFYSCRLGRDRLATALAYVDLNPVRASMLGQAEKCGRSSTEAHLRGVDLASLVDEWEWSELGLADDWNEQLLAATSRPSKQSSDWRNGRCTNNAPAQNGNGPPRRPDQHEFHNGPRSPSGLRRR